MNSDRTLTEGDTYNDMARPPVEMVCPMNPLGCRDQIVIGLEQSVYSEHPDHAEFTITTDPTEAPADALLEEAYDHLASAALCFASFDYANGAVFETWGRQRLALAMAPFDRKAETGWVSEFVTPAPTQPCTRCNGSGQVAGALGVGLTWTCGECAGSGKA